MTTNTPGKPRRETPPAAAAAPGPNGAVGPDPRPFTSGVRGRHRKPRPRKVVLAAGGLALAAGALSLVRLTSGPGGGATDTAEAQPHPDRVTGTDRATDTGASTAAAPEVSPSTPTALGGLSPTPLSPGSSAPRTSPTATPPPVTEPDATTIPQETNPAPAPPTTSTPHKPAPSPTPAPSRTTPAQDPEPHEPQEPDRPGLCVPLVGLCVDAGPEHGG